MLSEGEKKAIDCLKIVVDDINECGAEYYIDKDILSDIQTALNLIEKLQKENEEKDKNDNNNVYKDLQEDLTSLLKRDFIPKAVLRDTLDKHIVITDNTRYYNADSKQIINDIEKLLEE